MDVVKTTMGDLECLKWRSDVVLDLGSLARYASLGPETDHFANAMPDKLAGHELPSGAHRRVRETVDQVEHLAPPTCWDDGPRLAVGRVTEECSTVGAETDVFQLETSDGELETSDGGVISLDSWVHPLTGRRGSVIYALVECIDGGPGQRIGDMVVLALHMPNVRGKFGNVCEVSLLTT